MRGLQDSAGGCSSFGGRAYGSGFAVGFPEHCGRRLQQRAVVVAVLSLAVIRCGGFITRKREVAATVAGGAPAGLPAAF